MSVNDFKMPSAKQIFVSLLFFSVDPNFYSKNLLMLGKTYLAMKDKENALLWLTKAKEYPAHTLEDKDVRMHTHTSQIYHLLCFYMLYVSGNHADLPLQVHKEAVDLLKKLG